jgi:DNA primase
MNILDLLEGMNYTPKRKSATDGGEYSSPCPFCQDGKDRFLIWPTKENLNGRYAGGRFHCRACRASGDAITFLTKVEGLSYPEACERLEIQIEERERPIARRPMRPKLSIAAEPPELWKEKTKALVEWCNNKLMGNEIFLSALKKERGLSLETIEKFRLGYNPKTEFRERGEWGLQPETNKETGKMRPLWLPQGLVIPSLSGEEIVKVKIRRNDWKEGDKLPKYAEISGSKKCPSIYGNQSKEILVIVESELDAILIVQEAGDICFCLALGGSTKPLDIESEKLVKSAHTLLFCPDFDKSGALAWAKWKRVYPHSERLLTPIGKDPTEAYLSGVNLKEWITNIWRKQNGDSQLQGN